MKKIALIHPGRAYLPELEAYCYYFAQRGWQIDVLNQITENQLLTYDAEWHLLGIDRSSKSPNRLKIHEYISLSVPPGASLKNWLKRTLNTRPDLRIFHNEAVRQGFKFNDGVPFRFRGAGVGQHFFHTTPTAKRYDFVYHGAMDPTRQLDRWLPLFVERFPNYSLLLVGEPGYLQQRFSAYANIHFAGRVPYAQIPAWLQQAAYGLNFIPETYPYDRQPSLKLLEYCALHLKIITTSYAWVKQFAQWQGGQFFVVDKDWRNFYPHNITNFEYHTPDVTEYQWDNILDASGIADFLETYRQ